MRKKGSYGVLPLGGYWNKSHAAFRYQDTWKDEEIAFLKAHYPIGMALNSIAKETQHHTYEVKRKVEQLGLVRSTTPSLKRETPHGGRTFAGESIETVLRWLRARDHSVTNGVISGTYKMGHNDSMTPQQVVLFASDKSVRCGPAPPSPYAVNPDTGVPW